MAFEDLYYQSPSFGLLNFRYMPKDKHILASVAVSNANTTPGRFGLAKVETAYGVQLKKNISKETFLFAKDKLFEELKISRAAMEPELKRVYEKEKALDAGKKVKPVSEKAWGELFEEKVSINALRSAADGMMMAMTYWEYDAHICTYTAA